MRGARRFRSVYLSESQVAFNSVESSIRPALVVSLFLLTVACSSTPDLVVPPPPPPPLVESLTIGTSNTQIPVGDTLRLVAILRNAAGEVVTAKVSWSTTDSSVMIVSDSGLVTALNPGTAIITAQAGGKAYSRTFFSPIPIITLSTTEAEFGGDPFLNALPSQRSIQITNGAEGTLVGLVAGPVNYPNGQATNWLTVSLTSATAPTTLVLTPSAVGLEAGTYTATVPLTSLVTAVAPIAPIVVTMKVGGYAEVSSGSTYACARSRGGRVYCWGRNDFGQLGDATTRYRAPPAPIASDLRFTSLSTSQVTTCGVADSGDGYCWGRNDTGILGDGTPSPRLVPTLVTGGHHFTKIAVGNTHSCGLLTSGLINCWGQNFFGALGNGSNISSLVPTPIEGTDHFITVSAGYQSSCGVTTFGQLRCWGLTDGVSERHYYPALIAGNERFADVDNGGDTFACARSKSDVAYCWGTNTYGQLGDGTTISSATPVLVAGGHRFVSISVGVFQTCGSTVRSELYCWGPLMSAVGSATLVPTPGPPGLDRISVGHGFACGLSTLDIPYCWGANAQGQLGDGTAFDRLEPRRVLVP